MYSNVINIVSCNVRGLRKLSKLKALVTALNEHDVHLCCLQETYFTDEYKEKLEHEILGTYTCISSYGTNHSKGVSILVRNTDHIKIVNTKCDCDGRIIMLNLMINEKPYTVINLYAPNVDKERRHFFTKLEKWIADFAEEKERCLLVGDYNYTPDPKLDRVCSVTQAKYYDRSKETYEKLCKSLQLVDSWRVKNPSLKDYTCRSQSRIDLMLCTGSVLDKVKNIVIKQPFVYSDHKQLSVQLELGEQPRGPGYWKLNCSLLHDDVYVSEVRKIICNSKNVYNTTRGDAKLDVWELLKIKVKEYSIAYGKKSSRKQMQELKNLQDELNDIDVKMQANKCEELEIERKLLLHKLEAHYLYKARAAQIRAKARWIEEGEKSTKFFLNLEQQHQKHNTIKKLRSEDKEIDTINEIIEEVVRFYSELYKSKNIEESEMEEYLSKTVLDNTLDECDRELCEGVLDVRECTQAIKSMKKNKSPGSDGLPIEFYVTFWDDLKEIVVDVLNVSHGRGQMSTSQRRAIITLMFKKGDSELLQNWRPVSLLNSDYKIAAHVIANRIQKVLPKIISLDQAGYIKDRYIGSNTRLIEDIIEYVRENKMEGAALFCDFEKAFDTIEISFILMVLKKFNFGDSMQRWIRTFYNGIEANIKCNNWITCPVKMGRGIRQGCPVSALLFILAVETMAENIRKNDSIKGILLPDNYNTEAKIAQLADDATLFLKNKKSILLAIDEIEKFGNVAGTRLNKQKTIGMWLGKLNRSTDVVGNITWTTDPVKALGVYFGHDMKKREKLNWDKKIETLEKCLKAWNRRDLSLLGRILIVKTFGVSKLVYLSSTCVCPDLVIKKINKLIFQFVWNGKPDKVRRDTMIASKSNGGLDMVDFRLKDKSFKVKMLQRILDPGEGKWKILPRYYLDIAGPKNILLHVQKLPLDHLSKLSIPMYYKQLIMSLHACKKLPSQAPSTASDIRKQMIWGNKWILFKGKSLWFEKWINCNITFVNDLFDSQGKFDELRMHDVIQDKTNIISEMFILKNALPIEWKNVIVKDPCVMSVKYPDVSEIRFIKAGRFIYLKDVASSRDIYHVLVDIYKKEPCTKLLWSNMLKDKNIIWSNVYIEKLCNVKEQRIVVFNFKVLNNILATPYRLYKWKLRENDTCNMCFSVGNLEHVMLNCSYFSRYYSVVLEIFSQLGYANMKNNLYTLVCGYKPGVSAYRNINLLLNIIFFVVYKCWVQLNVTRVYVNPLLMLSNELKIRCSTHTYNNSLFLRYTEMLEAYI